MNIQINYDKETWFFDALILEKWIATQWNSLSSVIENVSDAIWLFNDDKKFKLKNFNLSFNENYVNS